MPKGTRVHRCVDKLRKRMSYSGAIGVCQSTTRQSYMTGRKLRKRTRKRGGRMKERIREIRRSTRKNKKYVASVSGRGRKRKIHFGDSRYEQFKDSTGLGYFSYKDHGSRRRRKNYFMRHSGARGKNKALAKERRASRGSYSPKLLSHKYLW